MTGNESLQALSRRRAMRDRLTEIMAEQADIARRQSTLIARQAELIGELVAAAEVERIPPQPERGAAIPLLRKVAG